MFSFFKKFRPPFGFVDEANGSLVRGWAIDPAESPAVVDVYVNGKLAGSATADRPRPDLKVHVPNGEAAFELYVASAIPEDATVEVRLRRTNTKLRFSRKEKGGGTEAEGIARWALKEMLLAVDLIERAADGTVRVTGWCIVNEKDDAFQILVNDVAFGRERTTFNKELTKRMTLPVGMEVRNVDVTAQIDASEIVVAIGYNGQATHPLRKTYYPRSPAILPDDERQKRVQGYAHAGSYTTTGYTIAKQLTQILGLHDVPAGAVLDWGCGCARVIQHMPQENLHGCDIDRDNVEWCRKNIPNATFSLIQTDRPTEYGEGFFSAIYGISVFTHLDAEHETFWLQELARITKPGGLVLVSTLGAIAALREGFLVALTGNRNAPVDRGTNPDLDSFIEDKEYYRNVFHTPQYIHRNWSRHFDVVTIYEGIVGGNQDLVVLRKR